MRFCIKCKSKTTYIEPKTGKIKWFKSGENYQCQKCHWDKHRGESVLI